MENEENTKQNEIENVTKTKEPSKIVVPGDIIKESMDILPGAGTFREGKNIISKVLGIAKTDGRVISVTPLNGVYAPQKWDYIIGEITAVNFSNWSVDINGPYEATLSLGDVKGYIERDADLSKFFAVGDLIFAKISEVSKTKYLNVTMKDVKARKLGGGFVVEITPTKVPRLIGKAGSMISMIKNRTNCMISVGQNGRVWIKGEHEATAKRAIEMIEENSHISGLTDKISEMLDKELGKAVEVKKPTIVKTQTPEEETEGDNNE